MANTTTTNPFGSIERENDENEERRAGEEAFNSFNEIELNNATNNNTPPPFSATTTSLRDRMMMTTTTEEEESEGAERIFVGQSNISVNEYTVEQAIDYIGFGKFQMVFLAVTGLSWLCDAMEMMLLSFIGPAARCEWRLTTT